MGIDVTPTLIGKESNEPIIVGKYFDFGYEHPSPCATRMMERAIGNRKVWTRTSDEEQEAFSQINPLPAIMTQLPRDDEVSSWLWRRSTYQMTYDQAVMWLAMQDEVARYGDGCIPDGPFYTLEELLNYDYDAIDTFDVLTTTNPTNWRSLRQKLPAWWFEFLEVCKKLDVEFIVFDIG